MLRLYITQATSDQQAIVFYGTVSNLTTSSKSKCKHRPCHSEGEGEGQHAVHAMPLLHLPTDSVDSKQMHASPVAGSQIMAAVPRVLRRCITPHTVCSLLTVQ